MRHTNVKSVKSATDLLLHKTSEAIWRRGEAYANSHKVHLLQRDEKETDAVAKGTKPYAVHLKFAANGMSRSCTCPYQGDVCKHMVATAIVWDEARGLARPSTEDIETATIPPPPVTRAQIHAVFASPLKADLDVLRLASESRGGGRDPIVACRRTPRSRQTRLFLSHVKKSAKPAMRLNAGRIETPMIRTFARERWPRRFARY